MNISETFIRRPIATSLLMAAIGLFGVSPTARCRSATCRRSITPPSRCRPASRSQPRHHGVRRGHPLGAAVHHHRRPGSMNSTAARAAPTSPCSSTSAAKSTALPWTSRRPSPKPCRCSLRACPPRRPSAKSTRATSRSLTSS